VILKSGNRRNLVVCGVLLLLALADAWFFADRLDLLQTGGKGVHAGLYLVVLLVSIIGGRIVPSFTANAIPGASVVQGARVDATAIILTLAAFVAVLAEAPGGFVAALAALAAVAHVVRQARWAPLRTWRRPILWILHASYAWIPIGLALLALAAIGAVPRSAALHALGAGAIGGMIISMITRTALGHTGRPLKAGVAEITAFVMVLAAAVLRVVASAAPGEHYSSLLLVSGSLWAIAFAIYFVAYLPRLLFARPDGKPG
jgi:uncharacterized protein involved in response to NO